jgi:hypothetical protein
VGHSIAHPLRILDLILNMSDERIAHLSTIRIHRRSRESDTGGPWTATCSYIRMREWEDPASQEVPAERAPWFEERRRFDRGTVPSTQHFLAVDKTNEAGDIEAQIRMLESSRLLGSLDAKLKMLPAEQLYEWVIHSHSGPEEQRMEWLMSIAVQ